MGYQSNRADILSKKIEDSWRIFPISIGKKKSNTEKYYLNQ